MVQHISADGRHFPDSTSEFQAEALAQASGLYSGCVGLHMDVPRLQAGTALGCIPSLDKPDFHTQMYTLLTKPEPLLFVSPPAAT